MHYIGKAHTESMIQGYLDRNVFHVERYQNLKDKNSPYFVGCELWNNVPLDVIHSPTVQQFRIPLKKLYKKYKEDV